MRGQSPGYPLRHNRSNSSLSMNMSDISTATLVGSTAADVANFTAEQLCDLGKNSTVFLFPTVHAKIVLNIRES